jgi:hypothetical protein
MIVAASIKTVAMGELADELGIYKQTVFKIANRLGSKQSSVATPVAGTN